MVFSRQQQSMAKVLQAFIITRWRGHVLSWHCRVLSWPFAGLSWDCHGTAMAVPYEKLMGLRWESFVAVAMKAKAFRYLKSSQQSHVAVLQWRHESSILQFEAPWKVCGGLKNTHGRCHDSP